MVQDLLLTLRRYMPIMLPAALLAIVALIVGGVELRSDRRDLSIGRAMSGGDPDRADAIVRRYGCGGCHTISGLHGADGQVAPPLTQFRQRVFIAGVVRNSPDNLVRFIVNPSAFAPGSAMPVTGIGEAEARDVAAYLYSR
jgi:cytochrome c2